MGRKEKAKGLPLGWDEVTGSVGKEQRCFTKGMIASFVGDEWCMPLLCLLTQCLGSRVSWKLE